MNGPLCVHLCLLDGQNSDYTTGQVFDLSEKLEQSEAQLGRGSFMLGLDTHDRKSEDKLAKATRDRYFLFIYFLNKKRDFNVNLNTVLICYWEYFSVSIPAFLLCTVYKRY